MAFLQKIIILLAGCCTILARSTYDYEYEPYRSFPVPWPVKYPQPLISIDGAWPISYSYPLHTSKYDDYSYEEPNYQQELLTKSLNKALTKLNQLFPPSSLNVQETTPFPPSTKPEVLAEALNKAIDRLGVLLTRQPLPMNKPEVSTEMSTEVTVVNRQPTVAPEKVSDSVSNAINELNKLFATLPDELKAKPNLTPLTNTDVNKPVGLDFQPMRPSPFLSQQLFLTELKPNTPNQVLVNTKESTTEGTLFTSHHLIQQNIVTEKIEENNNNIAATIVPSRNTDENDIFTTFVPIVETTSISPPSTVEPTVNLVDTTVLPKEINVVESTDLPTESNVASIYPPIREVETEIPTDKDDISTIAPTILPNIDIRFGEKENVKSDFLFPDEFEQMNQNKKPAVQDIDLASRFKEQSSTQITLEYKPSRPPIHPDIFPPNPSPRPQLISNLQMSTNFELGNRNKPASVNNQQQSFPQTDSNLHIATNFELSDGSKPATVNNQQATHTQRPIIDNQNPQITLEYNPSRPTFHPDIFPPHPTARPQTDSNLQTETNVELGDRNKPAIVNNQQQPNIDNQNPQITLEYNPSRPPFHPDIFPPHPTAKPQTDSNLQTETNFELGDRNKPAIDNNQQQPTQTQRPINNNQNTPIILEYKPSRPSFAPNPIFYPGQILTTSTTETSGSETLSTVATPDLADRVNVPETTSTTTEIFFTTTHNNEPYHPTHYYSTPISLEYKPTRPFYAPHPIVYPRPMIPPGTPWPASSTERPKN